MQDMIILTKLYRKLKALFSKQKAKTKNKETNQLLFHLLKIKKKLRVKAAALEAFNELFSFYSTEKEVHE